jgi:hydroxyacylglutathione hydrolase
MHTSLQALVGLPGATRLWFGHEYTAANLRFAAAIEPDNAAVRARLADLPDCTTPTTVTLELATNPFVRADSPQQFAERRLAKDEFRG